MRKMKSLMLEEAMSCVPELGAGRVSHLVKAFERLLSISKEKEREKSEEKRRSVMNWALPGYQQTPRAEETEISSAPSLFSSPELEREFDEQSSVDSNSKRFVIA